MISVRRPQSAALARARRAVAQAIRQTSSSAVASPNWIAIRPGSVADGWVSSTRAATTIAAAAVEPRTAAARSRRLICACGSYRRRVARKSTASGLINSAGRYESAGLTASAATSATISRTASTVRVMYW